VEGYQYASAGNRMRLRMFNVLDDVKRDYAFAPIVTVPSGAPPRHAAARAASSLTPLGAMCLGAAGAHR